MICKANVVKCMLSAPILKERIEKWIFALTEFDLHYKSAKSIRGQAVADFIVQHHDQSVSMVEISPWTLFFDGSSCKQDVVSAWFSYRLGGQVLSLLFLLDLITSTIRQSMRQYSEVFKCWRRLEPIP